MDPHRWYPWECMLNPSMMVPGNAAGVAKQFLRCIFHQLAPNGIFPQLFQSTIKGNSSTGEADTTDIASCWNVNTAKSDHWLSRWDFFTDLGHISDGLQRAELYCCSQPALGGRFVDTLSPCWNRFWERNSKSFNLNIKNLNVKLDAE